MTHHHHPLGKGAHQRQVVRDQQHRHAEFLLQVGQQLHDARLHGHVQCGGGFVGNHQLGPAGQRHGNQRPLPLSARKLVRVGGGAARRILDAGKLQQFQRTRHCLGAGEPLVVLHGLADLVTNRVQRIQCRHGLLKHHAHLATTQRAQGALVGRQHVLPLEEDLAVVLRALGQPHQRVRRQRLARAGLAHQRHPLAAAHRQVHVVHDALHLAGAVRQRDAQPPHLQQRRTVCRCLGCALCRSNRQTRHGACSPFNCLIRMPFSACAGPVRPAAPHR